MGFSWSHSLAQGHRKLIGNGVKLSQTPRSSDAFGEDALSANAYLSASGGCTGLSSTWLNHDILGDETRLSSTWIRRVITHRKSTLNFVITTIGSAGVVVW